MQARQSYFGLGLPSLWGFDFGLLCFQASKFGLEE
jgi:hypothetical protein